MEKEGGWGRKGGREERVVEKEGWWGRKGGGEGMGVRSMGDG
jgi:hypothetical protein